MRRPEFNGLFHKMLLICPGRLTNVYPLKEPDKIPASEVTDSAVYFNRRNFIRTGILAASAATNEVAGFRVAEPETSLQDITHYNNFYEFSTDKEGVASAAAGFETTGWQVSVEGLVEKPRVFALDDLPSPLAFDHARILADYRCFRETGLRPLERDR